MGTTRVFMRDFLQRVTGNAFGHRRTGNFLSVVGVEGAVNHLPKKYLQVAQFFYKTVEKKRGPYDATT